MIAFTDTVTCTVYIIVQTDRRAARRPADEVEAAATGATVASSSARRTPRVTQATSTASMGMGSPDAVLHMDSASVVASTANLRMARKKPTPNPLLEFDEEGAARLMEAFPLDVSSLFHSTYYEVLRLMSCMFLAFRFFFCHFSADPTDS